MPNSTKKLPNPARSRKSFFRPESTNTIPSISRMRRIGSHSKALRRLVRSVMSCKPFVRCDVDTNMVVSFSRVQTCVPICRAYPWAQRLCLHTYLTPSQAQGCSVALQEPVSAMRGIVGIVGRLQQYGQTCPLTLAGRSRWTWRGVRDGIDLAITEIHALHLLEVEGTGTHPSKDAYLVTAFIHCPVPVETF